MARGRTASIKAFSGKDPDRHFLLHWFSNGGAPGVAGGASVFRRDTTEFLRGAPANYDALAPTALFNAQANTLDSRE